MSSEHPLAPLFQRAFTASIATKQQLLADHLDPMLAIADAVIGTFREGHKVLLCGNGGSAADAQHIAAEWVTRYRTTRPALPALALTVNTSDLTAIGNDFDFDQIFARQLEAHAQPGDLLIAISTSGTSPNVVEAVRRAKSMRVRCVGLSGRDGGLLGRLADISLVVPGEETARIQEAHTLLLHAVCEAVDASLFADFED